MEQVTPFDWHRLFFGVEPPLYLLEIALRVVIIYFCGALLLRIGGKRDRKTLTAFELLIIIALGSAVGDALFYPDVPIIYAVVVAVSIIGLNRATAHLQACSPRAHDLLSGKVRMLVRDGKILDDAVRAESLAHEELLSMLRENGVRNTGEVERAYLELSGRLGVLKFPEGSERAGESTLPGRSQS